MTFNQLEILNASSSEKELTIDDAISFGKEILGEHKPYSVRKDIAGADIILFNVHFINCMRQAITDGCVARMSRHELAFWYEFVAYQNDIQDGTRDDLHLDITEVQASILQREAALEELSRWMYDELNGIPHPEIKECYVPYVLEA